MVRLVITGGSLTRRSKRSLHWRCLVVGRPEVDSLAEPDQKTIKIGTHSFPLKRYSQFSVKKG